MGNHYTYERNIQYPWAEFIIDSSYSTIYTSFNFLFLCTLSFLLISLLSSYQNVHQCLFFSFSFLSFFFYLLPNEILIVCPRLKQWKVVHCVSVSSGFWSLTAGLNNCRIANCCENCLILVSFSIK